MIDPEEILPERNAPVHAEHRRQVRKQIYLPLIVGILVVLAGVITIIIYGVRAESTLRRWADVSLIWVIIPVMFIGVLFMIATMGILFGVTRLLGVTPGYFRIVQESINQVERRVLQATDGLVEPVLKMRSSWAVLKHRGRHSSKQESQQ